MANDIQLQIQAEQEAQATVISYADWLVTTMNDALPQNNWTVPSPHPSAISKTTKPLLIQWSAIQSVVQHAALRLNLGSSHHADFIFQRICRMKLLLKLFKLFRPTRSEDRELTVEEISQARVKATLTTKRNDKRINSHNYVMLQHRRANADLQVIADTSTLTSVSGTWQSMQQKVNLDHSQHLKFSVCVLTGSAIQTWLHVHCEEQ